MSYVAPKGGKDGEKEYEAAPQHKIRITLTSKNGEPIQHSFLHFAELFFMRSQELGEGFVWLSCCVAEPS